MTNTQLATRLLNGLTRDIQRVSETTQPTLVKEMLATVLRFYATQLQPATAENEPKQIGFVQTRRKA